MVTVTRWVCALFLAPLFPAPSALATAPRAQCGWTSVPGAPAGVVNVLHVHPDAGGSALFVAGDLPGVGNVARFDGATWSPLGAGVDGPVSGLTTFDAGSGARLVAWGPFTHAGGQPTPGIALWNGSAWTALPGGLDMQPLAVAQIGEGQSARLAVGGHSPGSALRWFDGATWRAEWTWTDVIVDLEWFGGRLHAAGLWTLESWAAGATGPMEHVGVSPGHFFAEGFARTNGNGAPKLHAIGTAFDPTPLFLAPVPVGRAIHELNGLAWSPASANVAPATHGDWHTVRHFVPFDGPHGPSAVVTGDFAYNSGSWIENGGFAYLVRTQHGAWQMDVNLPFQDRLDAEPKAFAGYTGRTGATLFAGGAALSAKGVPLGNLAMLTPCPTVAPAWSMLSSCDPNAMALGSPFDQPVLGQPYTVQADAGPSMVGDAWLVFGLGQLPTDANGCGLLVPFVGEWLIAGSVGGGGLMLPSFFSPVGHFASAARWELPLPALPGFVGLELYMQAITRDYFTGAYALTRAFKARLGH